MKGILICTLISVIAVTAAAGIPNNDTVLPETPQTVNESTESETEKMDNDKVNIQIGDTMLTATLQDNEAVRVLKEMMADGEITVSFSRYGGFEQVGSLGRSLPRNDVQISASAGDIMLYSGNQIVIFYGSNSWSYTRLGKIDNISSMDLKNILGSEDVTATFSLAE